MRKNSALRRLRDTRRDPATWPAPDPDALAPKHAAVYRLRVRAMTSYVQGVSAKEIKRETGIDSSLLRHMFRRSTTIAPDGDIFGFRALVPFAHLVTYTRRSRVARHEGDGRGYCAGALSQLLERYPDVKDALIRFVLKPEGARNQSERSPSISDVHVHFIRLIREHGCEERGEWPFNTKSLGIASIRSFVKAALEIRAETYIGSRHGEVAQMMSKTGKGVSALLEATSPFDIVGIDEFTLDCITTLVLALPGGGEQEIAITRIHVLVVVDKLSRAVLSWHAFFSESVSEADMRQGVQKAMTPGKPSKFKLPISYRSVDSGFPSGLIPDLAYHSWTTIWLDNALAHQSPRLLTDLNGLMGSFVNLGPVKQWYRRAFIERRIKGLLEQTAQRLPSTTGDHPQDTKKSENPAEVAVQMKIRWYEVLELCEAVFADSNAEPTEGLGFLSPIEFLRQYVTQSERRFLPRPLPVEKQSPTAFVRIVEVKRVSGSELKGKRPFIVIDRVRYTNPALSSAWQLIGKQLRIGINEGDMRTVVASVQGSGYKLGELRARGAWGKVPHTREMRKAINRLKTTRQLFWTQGECPVTKYQDYLRDRAKPSQKSSSARISRPATKLAEIEHKTGLSPNEATLPTEDPPTYLAPEAATRGLANVLGRTLVLRGEGNR